MNHKRKIPKRTRTYRTSTMPLIGRELSFTAPTMMLYYCRASANIVLTSSCRVADQLLTSTLTRPSLFVHSCLHNPVIVRNSYLTGLYESITSCLEVVCGSLGSHLRNHDPRRDDMRTRYRTSSADIPDSFQVRWCFVWNFAENRQYSSTAVRFPICNDIS